MPVADKIAALLEALRGETFEGMAPAARRHLASLCRYIADKADPDKPAVPKLCARNVSRSSGVLAILKEGDRAP
jgi:hypothetical protein